MSLNGRVLRRALVFKICLHKDGTVRRTDYEWARIKSRWKGTYREAQAYYDEDPRVVRFVKMSQFQDTLDLLKEVGNLRRKLARQRNVVEYNRERGGLRMKQDERGRTVLVSEFERRLKSELYNEKPPPLHSVPQDATSFMHRSV